MKRIFKNTFLAVMAGIFMLAIVFTLGKSTFAQAVEGTALETQIGNLVSTLEKVFLEEKETEGGGMVMAAMVTSGSPNPTCLDNYNSWDHSDTYQEAPWNLDFIPREQIQSGTNEPISKFIDEQFVDLNGDGLADYIYKFSDYYYGYGTESTRDRTCVYLNNGSGFELAFRCIADVTLKENYQTVDIQSYYGDCADMS